MYFPQEHSSTPTGAKSHIRHATLGIFPRSRTYPNAGTTTHDKAKKGGNCTPLRREQIVIYRSVAATGKYLDRDLSSGRNDATTKKTINSKNELKSYHHREHGRCSFEFSFGLPFPHR